MHVENERGRTEILKVGLAPVQREGMDYEFGIVFDLSADHTASVSNGGKKPPEELLASDKEMNVAEAVSSNEPSVLFCLAV